MEGKNIVREESYVGQSDDDYDGEYYILLIVGLLHLSPLMHQHWQCLGFGDVLRC
jgi:hypothetical protein